MRVPKLRNGGAVIAGVALVCLVEISGQPRAAPATRIETDLPVRESQPRADLNCSSSVDPLSATTDEAPPWMTVVTSSK
jgi:hypothetical protein